MARSCCRQVPVNRSAWQCSHRAKAEQARAAGAEIVGMEDLAEQVKAGKLDFDIVIASPDTMRVVGTLGQILGPRGLMPNPKVGTVTADVATAVKNAKAGQVQFRVDKAGIIHATIGRASFEPTALRSNLNALVDALQKRSRQRAKVSTCARSLCRARWVLAFASTKRRSRHSKRFHLVSARVETLLWALGGCEVAVCITQPVVKDRWRARSG